MLYDINIAKKITGIDDEELLTFYIDAIINKISHILGYNIIKHETQEHINGFNANYIYVNDRPLNSIIEAKKDGYDITTKCFIISNRKIGIPFELCNQESMFVKYDAGYDELPKAVQAFIFSQVSNVSSDTGNLKSYSIESISYTYIDKISQEQTFINEVKNLFGGL